MADTWKRGKVGDVSHRVTKGTTPTTLGGRFTENGVSFVKVESITEDGRIDQAKLAHIDNETNLLLSRSILQQDDILFTIAGTIGRVAMVPDAILPANTNQAVAIIRPNINFIEPKFLYYALRDKTSVQDALARVVQSVQANFSLGELSKLEIPLPDRAEQEAIARVLGTLDEKIELNRRMKETLEGIARALFRSWFVDFDPVRAKEAGREPVGMGAETAALFPDSFDDTRIGQAPSGWRVVSIGEVGSLEIGGDWGQETPFEESVEVICLRGVDLEHLRRSGFASEAPKRWIKKKSLERRGLDELDVLIAGSGAGPTGRPLWMCKDVIDAFDQPLTYSNFCKRVRCKHPATAAYLDRCLHEMRDSGEIWEYVNGTSVPNLNAQGLLSSKHIVLPPLPILEQYTSILQPILARLYSHESRTLAAIRDTLLPKLLSGELRVPDAERIAVEVT